MKLFEQKGYKGGVKAGRNNPKCYSKQNQKEIQSGNKTSFLRKHLSLESPYDLLGISKNLINLLKVGASGDVSSKGENSNSPTRFHHLDYMFLWGLG